MNNPKEILDLAYQRLDEAVLLCEHGRYDGAFYLAGYSVELALKARICTNIGLPALFDEDKDNEINKISSVGEIRRFLKTHNLTTLLFISGLKPKFDDNLAMDKEFANAGALLFNDWSEKTRYKHRGHADEKNVKKLISLLSDNTHGLLKWIEQS